MRRRRAAPARPQYAATGGCRMTEMKPETLTVHAGTAPDPTTKARITPIYQTSSYVFDSVEHASRLFNLAEFGNIYPRIMNTPTGPLEGKLAAQEGGKAALEVASGHAGHLLSFPTRMEPGSGHERERGVW